MADVISDPALSLYFHVKVDDVDLGTFTSVEGLGVEVDIEKKEEGGNQFFVHQIPGRLRYTNIKLTRVINGDTQKVANWFAGMASGVKRSNAQIIAKSAFGDRTVAQWGLLNAVPVRWTGPRLSAETTTVATESLELAHHGFFEPGQGDPPASPSPTAET
jgi:phage tail-like protein